MTVKKLVQELQRRRDYASKNLYASTMNLEYNAGLITQTDIDELQSSIESYSRAEKFYNDMLFEIEDITQNKKAVSE
jgi:hypothetical protein